MSARFITLEGVEGAGKSTQIPALRNWLSNSGIDVVVTREPGGTEVGEGVRSLLLAQHESGMHPDTELLLMFAARAEHIRRVILPALDEGRWVLSDRFTDASYAYQGGGRGIEPDRIEILETWVQDNLRPDLVLVLDLPVGVGLRRAAGRGAPDRFEDERREFFDRVRAAYRQRAALDPTRYRIVDANCGIETVQLALQKAVAERFRLSHD